MHSILLMCVLCSSLANAFDFGDRINIKNPSQASKEEEEKNLREIQSLKDDSKLREYLEKASGINDKLVNDHNFSTIPVYNGKNRLEMKSNTEAKSKFRSNEMLKRNNDETTVKFGETFPDSRNRKSRSKISSQPNRRTKNRIVKRRKVFRERFPHSRHKSTPNKPSPASRPTRRESPTTYIRKEPTKTERKKKFRENEIKENGSKKENVNRVTKNKINKESYMNSDNDETITYNESHLPPPSPQNKVTFRKFIRNNPFNTEFKRNEVFPQDNFVKNIPNSKKYTENVEFDDSKFRLLTEYPVTTFSSSYNGRKSNTSNQLNFYFDRLPSLQTKRQFTKAETKTTTEATTKTPPSSTAVMTIKGKQTNNDSRNKSDDRVQYTFERAPPTFTPFPDWSENLDRVFLKSSTSPPAPERDIGKSQSNRDIAYYGSRDLSHSNVSTNDVKLSDENSKVLTDIFDSTKTIIEKAEFHSHKRESYVPDSFTSGRPTWNTSSDSKKRSDLHPESVFNSKPRRKFSKERYTESKRPNRRRGTKVPFLKISNLNPPVSDSAQSSSDISESVIMPFVFPLPFVSQDNLPEGSETVKNLFREDLIQTETVSAWPFRRFEYEQPSVPSSFDSFPSSEIVGTSLLENVHEREDDVKSRFADDFSSFNNFIDDFSFANENFEESKGGFGSPSVLTEEKQAKGVIIPLNIYHEDSVHRDSSRRNEGILSSNSESKNFLHERPVTNPLRSFGVYLKQHGISDVDLSRISPQESRRGYRNKKEKGFASKPRDFSLTELAFSDSQDPKTTVRSKQDSMVPVAFVRSSSKDKRYSQPNEVDNKENEVPFFYPAKTSVIEPHKNPKRLRGGHPVPYANYPPHTDSWKHYGQHHKRPVKLLQQQQRFRNSPKNQISFDFGYKYPSKNVLSFRRQHPNRYKINPPVINTLQKQRHSYKTTSPFTISQLPMGPYVRVASFPPRRYHVKETRHKGLTSSYPTRVNLPNYLRPPPPPQYNDLKANYIDNVIVSLTPDNAENVHSINGESRNVEHTSSTLSDNSIFYPHPRYVPHTSPSLPTPHPPLRPPFYPTRAPSTSFSSNEHKQTLQQQMFSANNHSQPPSRHEQRGNHNSNLPFRHKTRTENFPHKLSSSHFRVIHDDRRSFGTNSKPEHRPDANRNDFSNLKSSFSLHTSESQISSVRSDPKSRILDNSIRETSQPLPKEIMPRKRGKKIPESHVSMLKSLKYGVNGEPLDVWIPIPTYEDLE